jgi:molybdopterin synthase catalytic subunit
MIEVEIGNGRIEWKEIDPSGLMDPAFGAFATFTGVVRNLNHGREVTAVAYDAFVPLAERVLKEICEKALRNHGGRGSIRVRHRIGTLQVGEMSTAILVCTPHRDEAFRICREVIEELKERAPIWKKEFYSDGETQWLKGHALCGSH